MIAKHGHRRQTDRRTDKQMDEHHGNIVQRLVLTNALHGHKKYGRVRCAVHYILSKLGKSVFCLYNTVNNHVCCL